MTPVRDQRQHAVTSRATGSWCTCRTRCRWTTRCTRHGWPLPAPSRSSPGHLDGRGTAAAGLGDALLLATLFAANDARTPWPTSFGKVTPPEDIAYRMMRCSQAHAGPESRCPSGAVEAREGHLPTISWTAAAMGMATRAPITPNRAPPSRTANNRPSLEPNGIRVGSGPHDLPRGSHPNCHKPIVGANAQVLTASAGRSPNGDAHAQAGAGSRSPPPRSSRSQIAYRSSVCAHPAPKVSG